MLKKVLKYKKIYIGIVVGLLIFVIGGTVGAFLGFNYEHDILVKSLNTIRPIRDHNASYKFISPLLAYIIPQADQLGEFASLKNKVAGFINNAKNDTTISQASVFFYDLNKGRWIGVNESQKYNPASMLKVVIMVSYLKTAESDSTLLQKKLIYTSELDNLIKINQFNAKSNLKIGSSYSVDELIHRMIIDSDNGAEFLLLNSIDANALNAIYTALNITSPEKAVGDFVISPRIYSLFFRTLYSATYLSREMSENALMILSQTTFNKGIIAGLPDNITVAHKFGEYVSQENGTQMIELHDCGIIYNKESPYLLCVMTKGDDVGALESFIEGISKLIYQNL